MKRKRHLAILEIIEKNDINTQEALQLMLNQQGYNVTQATVSRDIKELGLVKILSFTGEYKYALAPGKAEKSSLSLLVSLLNESVDVIDYAVNTVVIKCHTGMAQAVCAKLDATQFTNVVGSLAGDDTIFVIMRSENDAVEFVDNLNALKTSR